MWYIKELNPLFFVFSDAFQNINLSKISWGIIYSFNCVVFFNVHGCLWSVFWKQLFLTEKIVVSFSTIATKTRFEGRFEENYKKDFPL